MFFAKKILREYNQEVGLQKNFSIADESESINLLKETIKELGLEDIVSIATAIETIGLNPIGASSANPL